MNVVKTVLITIVSTCAMSAFASINSAEDIQKIDNKPIIGEELTFEFVPSDSESLSEEQSVALDSNGFVEVAAQEQYASRHHHHTRHRGETAKARVTSVGNEAQSNTDFSFGGRTFGAVLSDVKGKGTSAIDSFHTTGRKFSGMASYYGNDAGLRTASGQRFNQEAMTVAHRSLPFGTFLRVTHGQKSVIVRVNDRGPFVRGRVVDLSKGAARVIGLIGVGVGRVTCEVVEKEK